MKDDLLLEDATFEFSDPELDFFLGKARKKLAKAARSVAKPAATIAKTVAKPAAASFRQMAAPATLAKNVGKRLARGESLGSAMKGAAKSYVKDARQVMQMAKTVAPFIPGVGTGVAAALSAGEALASGRPITEAAIAAARGALPGGALTQTAFDMGVSLAKGRNISQAALDAARQRLPGGPAAQAGFDAAVALARGKRLQDAALAAGRGALPPSLAAAHPAAFANAVGRDRNPQAAALSSAGRSLLREVLAEAGPIGNELAADLELDFEDLEDFEADTEMAFETDAEAEFEAALDEVW